uniref:Reverse transcriptase/retrotransposon-derived protein RNase H-like domain-containing protein n=2 Tax=Aegilops tauschii subsp. strangulata TaxID=200361 RepID=A0A453DET6_AEGTS
GVPFVWTDTTKTAFQVLKQQLISAPVLALPDFQQRFIIETDASDRGIGAILQQQGHPIAFMSKALSPRYQGLSTYEKEYLAIVVAVDQWRPYLQHAEFDILTDQKSLTHLEEQRLTTPWQQKAFTKLLGLRYRIRYKKGVENTGADALSRSNTQDTLFTVSSCQPAWLEDVISSYNNNTMRHGCWNNCQYAMIPKVASLFSKEFFDSEAESGWEGVHKSNKKLYQPSTTALWEVIQGSR